MQKDGKVSLWLGNFNNEETFKEFKEIKYTDNGNSTPLKFKKQFRIEYYYMILNMMLIKEIIKMKIIH